MVLKRPEIPSHNNLSECDIREYVKRRKISGSTRSDDGRGFCRKFYQRPALHFSRIQLSS